MASILITSGLTCGVAWRGPCESTGRDRTDRQVQAIVMSIVLIPSIDSQPTSSYACPPPYFAVGFMRSRSSRSNLKTAGFDAFDFSSSSNILSLLRFHGVFQDDSITIFLIQTSRRRDCMFFSIPLSHIKSGSTHAWLHPQSERLSAFHSVPYHLFGICKVEFQSRLDDSSISC